MTLLRRLADAHAARTRVVMARTRASASTHAIEKQLQARPMACLGVAFGAGWLLRLHGVRLWRMRAFVRLVSMQVWPWAVRLMNMARSPS